MTAGCPGCFSPPLKNRSAVPAERFVFPEWALPRHLRVLRGVKRCVGRPVRRAGCRAERGSRRGPMGSDVFRRFLNGRRPDESGFPSSGRRDGALQSAARDGEPPARFTMPGICRQTVVANGCCCRKCAFRLCRGSESRSAPAQDAAIVTQNRKPSFPEMRFALCDGLSRRERKPETGLSGRPLRPGNIGRRQLRIADGDVSGRGMAPRALSCGRGRLSLRPDAAFEAPPRPGNGRPGVRVVMLPTRIRIAAPFP